MAIPGSRPNNRLILVVGIVCAVLAFAGVLFLLKGSGGGPTQTVVVFKTDLAAGTSLTSDNVTTASVPQSAVGRGAITDPSTVVGKQVVNNVFANDIVTNAVLAAPGTSVAGTATATGGLSITKGYVALAIPTALTYPTPSKKNPYALVGGSGDILSAGYYAGAGDHIDVLIINQGKVRFAFQDLRILKVGDNPGTAATTAAATSAAGAVYIVEVPRSQAEILATLFHVTCNAAADETVLQQCVQPAVVAYVLRPKCEYGDTNYIADAQSFLHDKTLTATSQLSPAQHDKLVAQCINPYPFYEPLTNTTPGFPNQLTPVPDGGETPQQLQQLFP